MNLKQLIEKATKEKVLVIKNGDEYVRNPSLSEARRIIGKALEMKFTRTLDISGKGPFGYVLQFHVRGRSVHIDFRFQTGKGHVTGYTIATPMSLSHETYKKIENKIEEIADSVTGGDRKKWRDYSDAEKRKIRAKLSIPKRLFIEEFEDKFQGFIRNWNKKNLVEMKSMQDESWFGESYKMIPPGFVGATVEEWAALIPFDKGKIEFGTIKPDYHEIWLKSDSGFYNGKLAVTWLPRDQVAKEDADKLGSKTWVGFLFSTKSTEPYILSSRAINDDYMPPSGESFLPSSFESMVPKNLRFWEVERDKKKARKELAEWAKENIEYYERSSEKDIPDKNQFWERKK